MAEVVSKNQWKRTRHLQLVSDLVSDLLHGDLDYDAVVFSFPPRHGKSSMVSHWVPVWAFDRNPRMKVGLASYAADVAGRWGRKVRNTIQENPGLLRCRVSQDSKARSYWNTTAGGLMMTAGVDGPFTGEGFDLLIFDDLYKGWRQAYSKLYRDMVAEWIDSVALPRLEPGGVILVPMTRWHVDDAVGVLTKGGGLKVKIVNFPAIADENDEIGRKPGEALWPERYPIERLLKLKGKIRSDIWDAVFGGKPRKDKGETFDRSRFRYWKPEMNDELVIVLNKPEGEKRVPLRECLRFSTVDLAVKPGKRNDFVVNAAWALTPWYDLCLFDRLRFKRTAPGQLDAFRQFHTRNTLAFQVIESVAFQMAMVQFMREGDVNNPPLPVREFNPGRFGNKEQRAASASVFIEGGKMYYPSEEYAPWLPEWEAEMTDFPDGEHDDQVDTQSMAVLLLVAGLLGADDSDLELDSELLSRASPWGS